MNFHTVICTNCGNSLTVSDRAPAKLTCPRCLGSIENPKAENDAGMPIPVLPLETETTRDKTLSRLAVGALAVLVTIGVVLVLLKRERGASSASVAIPLVTVLGSAMAVLISNALKRHLDLSQSKIPETVPPVPGNPRISSPMVLPYRTAWGNQ